MVMRAPIVFALQRLFRNWTRQRKLLFCQILVLILTYLTYTSYHAAKRPFSVMKGVLAPDCNVTKVNNTCHPWKPFDNKKKSKDLFGMLDAAFLTTYAISMFVSGYIAEHTNLRIYLSIGMVLTGLLTSALGLAYYLNIHNLAFFFALLTLTGVTQSTGWPCVVECVGMWFPKGRRGVIMGIWNTHVSVGNIVGSAIAGIFASNQWGLSFIVPGVIIGGLGIINFFFLVPDPAHLNICVEESQKKKLKGVEYGGLGSSVESDSRNLYNRSDSDCTDTVEVEVANAVGALSALKIPGVIEYSFCLFFAKLVSYTFLFWLPFYINATPIGGKNLDVTQSADLATLFDVGGALGGIAAGVLVDCTGSPGIVNVFMLIIAAPFLFLFKFYGSASYTMFVTYMMISGFFVNGPYALITTAVSASLGTHKSLQGNTKAMAVVTAIIDATGSLGAAIGPLLAGLVSSKSSSWDDVFYMLIGCDILAAILLSRQFIKEIRSVCSKFSQWLSGTGDVSVNSSNEERTALLAEDA